MRKPKTECWHSDTKIDSKNDWNTYFYRRICLNCLASTKWCWTVDEAKTAKWEEELT